MTKLTFPALSKLLTKTKKSDTHRHLSNMWFSNGRLKVGLYESHFTRSYYCFHLEMDLNGKILALKKDDSGLHPKEFKQFESLIGKTIDLKTYTKDGGYIKERPVGVEDARVLGFVTSGKFIKYTPKNAHKITFSKTYKTNNQAGFAHHGGFELTSIFNSIIKKHKLKTFSILDASITYYRGSFDYQGFSVNIELQSFFNYNLSLTIYQKNAKGESLKVTKLEGRDVESWQDFIKNFKNKTLSVQKKTEMMFSSIRCSNIEIKQTSKTEARVDIKYSSLWNKARGEYTFAVDFNTNTIQCLEQKRSTSFIPKELNKYQRNLDHVVQITK